MKNIYKVLSLAFVLIPFFGFGQITIDPNPGVTESIDISEYETVIYGFITNDADETKTFTWNRTEISMSDGWESAVCDPTQCYGWESSSPDFTFDLGPGESDTWDIHIYPFNNEGSAVVRVTAAEVGNFPNNVTALYYFNTSVSVAEHLNEAIKIYPNPAEDLIFIEGGEQSEVNRIELFNLAGKLLIDSSVINSNSVEVSSLSTGTYIARLYDKDDVQVSSNVVIKK